jgi:hypothetical protein
MNHKHDPPPNACPQTHKASLAASCLMSASRRNTDRRRIRRIT